MVKTKKIQVRLTEQDYDRLYAMLDIDETVSDFIREAIRLKMTLRHLHADN